MRITSKQRKRIEDMWIKQSYNIAHGEVLCAFFRQLNKYKLAHLWNLYWYELNDERKPSIGWYLIHNSDVDLEVAYLLRAMVLNGFLDSIEDKEAKPSLWERFRLIFYTKREYK